jgi:hypothetical protein
MTACKFCGHLTDADPVCTARKPPRGAFLCTREPNHDGDHVACTPDKHAVETWPKNPRTESKSA